MTELQRAIVEDFGRGYAKFGHSELLGRVVGLLLCATEPLTEAQIGRELQVSKSPINQITSRLEELNLVRRVRRPGDRKFYYEISRDVFLQAGKNLSRLFEDNLHVAEAHLGVLLKKYAEARGEERLRLRRICERFIAMREFHVREILAYRRFLAEWSAAKAELPGVDDYLARWDTQAA